MTKPPRNARPSRPLLLARILLVLGSLAAAGYLISDYTSYQRERRDRSQELGRQAGLRVAEALEAELFAISKAAHLLADEVLQIDDEDRLHERLRAETLAMPLVLAVTVAYEPGRYRGKDLYAPFFNQGENRIEFVEDTYDYTSHELETARWYTRVVDTREAQWSDPFHAKAVDTMVVDYGVPLFDSAGEVIGIVDYLITLLDFTKIVDSLSVGESGYGFTYDADGAILSHPDADYLLQNVFQLRDGKTESIVDQMRNDPEGVVQYQSTYTYRSSWFFFRALESTGWRSVLVFAEDDLLGASDQGRRKTIHAALGVSAFLITVLVLTFGIGSYTPRKLWWIVTGLSAIVLSNIVLIWYLNLSTDFSLVENDEERIVNKTILSKYLEEFDRTLHKLTRREYHHVPTGIFVESYELAAFEASLIGKLWMKYPKELYETAPPSFYFPDVSAIESRGLVSKIISEIETDNHVLVTWTFRATVEQEFSYQQFPFEQNDIQLKILYPDLGKNILLIPDLDSYDVLNPSARPGLNTGITVPSSDTLSSFFTFKTIDYKTTFGNLDPVNSHPALVFNLAAKRIYLSPFIANIIPILIVALIMFIVLFVSSNEEDGRSGLTTMNVIQSSAGFLFILLLAHVNERNRIETPEIAYIELFYFSMYVLLTLQAVLLAVSLRGSSSLLFAYHDNLILKLAFWPALLSTWLVVTLLRFY